MNRPVIFQQNSRLRALPEINDEEQKQIEANEIHAVVRELLYNAAQNEDVVDVNIDRDKNDWGEVETKINAGVAFVNLDEYNRDERRPEGFTKQDKREILERLDPMIERVKQKIRQSFDDVEKCVDVSNKVANMIEYEVERVFEEKAIQEWITETV